MVGAAAVLAGCDVPGVVLALDAEPSLRAQLGGYCVSLGADGQRRFGRRYDAATFPLPQTLGVRADGRASATVRLDGIDRGLRVAASVQALDATAFAHGDARIPVELVRCAARTTGAPRLLGELPSGGGARVAIVRTGAEAAGGATLVVAQKGAGARQAFGPTGAVGASVALAGAGGAVQALAALDVDGDCGDDLIVAATGRTPEVWPAAADGGLVADPARIAAVPPASALALGDLDGDGRADLATVGDEGGTVLLASASGGGFGELGGAFDVQPTQGRAIALGDLDGDGALDAVVGFPQGPLRWFHGDGHGRLRIDPTPFPAPSPDSGAVTGVVLIDLDGDGDLDVLVAVRGGATGLRLFENQGGAFVDRTSLLPKGPPAIDANVAAILVGDLDGDCADEVIVLGDTQPPLRLRVAQGALVAAGTIGALPASAGAIADLDGDGVADLAVATATGVAAWTLGGAP